eukprot:s1328_g5.t1
MSLSLSAALPTTREPNVSSDYRFTNPEAIQDVTKGKIVSPILGRILQLLRELWSNLNSPEQHRICQWHQDRRKRSGRRTHPKLCGLGRNLDRYRWRSIVLTKGCKKSRLDLTELGARANLHTVSPLDQKVKWRLSRPQSRIARFLCQCRKPCHSLTPSMTALH